jgi:hypothetical protein
MPEPSKKTVILAIFPALEHNEKFEIRCRLIRTNGGPPFIDIRLYRKNEGYTQGIRLSRFAFMSLLQMQESLKTRLQVAQEEFYL